MRHLRTVKVSTPNSLTEWYKVKNPLIVTFNFLVIYCCKYLPSLALKRFLLRLTGMRIEDNASVGLGASFDIFFPELITIKENSVIGFNALILCHEFLIKEYRTGETIIGRNVVIGANSTVLAGVEIGDNSIIGACSLVNSDVPSNSFYAGIPAREIKRKQ